MFSDDIKLINHSPEEGLLNHVNEESIKEGHRVLPTLLKQGAAPCFNFGPPCLNLGTLLKKPSTLLEVFSKTRFSFRIWKIFKNNLWFMLL
jgi:hypothetical protein